MGVSFVAGLSGMVAAVLTLLPFPGVETQGQVTLRALEAVRMMPPLTHST